MVNPPDIPAAAWRRRLDETLSRPGRPGGISPSLLAEMLPGVVRTWRFARQARRAGREPAMRLARPSSPGPVMGVPLGGIGGGTITRGWQGGFVRWQLRPGLYSYDQVPADQFSLFVARSGAPPVAQVLYPGHPRGGQLAAWAWDMPGQKATYHALYPRAWTVYEDIAPGVRLTCRQVSPIIPHNYRESSFPVAVFAWTIENTGDTPATVGLMFSFQNGSGVANDFAGGHSNHPFMAQAARGEVIGVALHHVYRQPEPIESGRIPHVRGVYKDPLTFAIAAQAGDGVEVTYSARFETTGNGADVWGDFAGDGRLSNGAEERPSAPQTAIAAALCATVEVPAGARREVHFALAWDMPLARFGDGRGHYRRYTRFYGRRGMAAPQMARDALQDYPDWEAQIASWQAPVLDDPGLPDWYKSALFNETYYIADGGTVWTDGDEVGAAPEEGIGHFAYLEGHEYLMYNTYDVHFYASFALATLWPELELSLQRDFARALPVQHPEVQRTLLSGRLAPRKVAGAIPHDLGGPTEDPWHRLNIYNWQDVSRWKDLNAKFVLQVYRDYVATWRTDFLRDTWEAVVDALAFLRRFDRDGDGLIENDGYPDQTYDTWSAKGPSAYSGGLWLAALGAGAAIAEALGATDQAREYRALLERGQAAYEERLWNGEYYLYDGSGARRSLSIMADQLAGDWYARACRLPPVAPAEHARRALRKVYDYNVMRFGPDGAREAGTMGAVNGMRPDGAVDTSSLQSQEVWTGTTFAVAAAMLQLGMQEEAFATARGIYVQSYERLGYWFMTPEAWTAQGAYRSLAYMRPLAIWALQWAWDRK